MVGLAEMRSINHWWSRSVHRK